MISQLSFTSKSSATPVQHDQQQGVTCIAQSNGDERQNLVARSAESPARVFMWETGEVPRADIDDLEVKNVSFEVCDSSDIDALPPFLFSGEDEKSC